MGIISRIRDFLSYCWEKMGLKNRPRDNEAGSPNQGHKKLKHKRGSSTASNQPLFKNESEIATSSRPSRPQEKYAKIKRGPNTKEHKSSKLASQVPKSTGQTAARQRRSTSKEKQEDFQHISTENSADRQTVHGEPREKNTYNNRFVSGENMVKSDQSQQMQNQAKQNEILGNLTTHRTRAMAGSESSVKYIRANTTGIAKKGTKVDEKILRDHLINSGRQPQVSGVEARLHKTRSTVPTYQTESSIVLPVNLNKAESVATQPKQEVHNEGNPTDRQSQDRYEHTNKSHLHHHSDHRIVKQENLIKNPAEHQLKENTHYSNLSTTAKNQRIIDHHSQHSEEYKGFAKFDPEQNSRHTKPQLQNISFKVEVNSNTQFKDFVGDDHALKVSKSEKDAKILIQSLKFPLDTRSASRSDPVTYNKSSESTITLPEVEKTETNISEVDSDKGKAISHTEIKFAESDKSIQSFDASVSEKSVEYSVVHRITDTKVIDFNMVESSENRLHTVTQESQSQIEQNVMTDPIHTLDQDPENLVPMVKQGIKRNSIDDSPQPWKKTYLESPKTIQVETPENKVNFGDLDCKRIYEEIWSPHQVIVTDPIQVCENLEDTHFAEDEVQHKQEHENGVIDQSMQMIVKVEDKYLPTFNKIEQLFQESRKFEKLASEFVGKVGTQEHYYIDESLARLLLQLDDLGVLKNETLKLERRKVIKYIYHLLDVLEERATS